jgi:probable F420-dependent oxidoreductase
VKLALAMPFDSCPPKPDFLSGEALAGLGRLAEDSGFHSVFLTEHPAPGERWRQAGGHDALDPFVGLSFIAAATSNLRLLTCLVVLPYRNPFLLAKTAASLDVLSGGRVELGIGTGYLKAEFFALGVDFDERNALFDEALEVLPMAWSGEPFTYEGRHFSAREVCCQPPPVQRPGPPLWLGGNSKLTRRRVVDLGAGWMPMPNPPATASTVRSPVLETIDDLRDMLRYCAEFADSVGKPATTEVMFGLPAITGDDGEAARHIDLAKRYREVGVTALSVGAHVPTRAQFEERIKRYADEVVAPLAQL